MSSPDILQVAVPAPLFSLFDYLPPAGCAPEMLRAGVRVRVPFGSTERCGLILALRKGSGQDTAKLKKAIELLEPEPLLRSEDRELLRWAADYYRHPIGEVIAGALPLRLRRCLSQASIVRTGWRLSSSGRQVDPESLKRAPRQAQLLRVLGQSPDGLSRDEVVLRVGECRQVVRTMQEKGWLESCELQGGADGDGVPALSTPLELNNHQAGAVAAVTEAMGRFGVFLLDGVTGSGKTEVYLHLVEQVLEIGRASCRERV